LIKAIRTTYNIFLVSASATAQTVAQSALTQMVQNVFGRIPKLVKQEIEVKKDIQSIAAAGDKNQKDTENVDEQ
jgi:brefeldin A-inhibited guanine nucleotide-exchange protein